MQPVEAVPADVIAAAPGIPPGAVDLAALQAPDEVEENATFIEHIDGAIDYVQTLRAGVGNSPAGREFSICLTHLEDVQMRFNRGMALVKHGRITTADLEKEQ